MFYVKKKTLRVVNINTRLKKLKSEMCKQVKGYNTQAICAFGEMFGNKTLIFQIFNMLFWLLILDGALTKEVKVMQV